MSSYIKLRFGRLTFCLHLYSANKLNAKKSWNCPPLFLLKCTVNGKSNCFSFKALGGSAKKNSVKAVYKTTDVADNWDNLDFTILRIPTAPRLVSRQLLDWTTSRYYLSWYSPALCNITSTPPNLIFHIVGCPICYKSCKNRKHLATGYPIPKCCIFIEQQ